MFVSGKLFINLIVYNLPLANTQRTFERRKRMKRIIIPAITLLLTLSLLSCKEEGSSVAPTPTSTSTSATTANPEVSFGNGVYFIPNETYGKRLAELKGQYGVMSTTPVTENGTTIGYYVITTSN
jgi:hypothetical protein